MKKGFTLLELMVVMIVMGVMAAAALPSYQRHMQRMRVTEGVHALSMLREAQLRYKLENGAYAANLAQLDIDIPASANFDAPTVTNASASIVNHTDNYTLFYSDGWDSSNINCTGALCSAVGYTPY